MGGSGLLAVLLMDIFFHRCLSSSVTSMFSYVQVIHSEEEEEQEMRRSQEPGEN